MLLSFCGAAGTVTGSCYWLQTGDCQFLVDCGMFQGPSNSLVTRPSSNPQTAC